MRVSNDQEFVTPAELLAAARSLNPTYSESTLRFWRRQGLLPQAERINGKLAYPVYAVDQLRAIARWRARGVRNIDATKVALWVEGFPVPLDEIRRLLQAFFDSWAASIALFTEQPEDSGTPTPAIEATVREIAAMRSRSPLPEPMRKRRMKRQEREEALIFAALSLTGQAAEVAKRLQAASFLDRLLGLDRRRTAMKPLLTSADPLSLLRMADPERLRTGAFEADPEELEYARRLLQISLRYGGGFVALLVRDLGPSVRELFAMLMQATPPRMTGPLLGFAITSLAGAAHANRDEFDLPGVLRELQSEFALYELHQALEKASDQFVFRSGLREADRVALEARLRDEGKLPRPGELLRRDIRLRQTPANTAMGR
jgi:DNA-binding transcriptional MerR regulator